MNSPIVGYVGAGVPIPKPSLSGKRRIRHFDTAKSMGFGNAARGFFGTTGVLSEMVTTVTSPWPLFGAQVPDPEFGPLSGTEKVGVLNSKQSFSVVARLSPSALGLLSPGPRQPSLPTLD
jgi:hypothetical protein